MTQPRENYAFVALVLMILVSMPVYAYLFPNHPSGPEYVIGDFQVRSTSVEIRGTSLGGLDLSFKALVYNPNVLGGALDSANYSVYANGHYVGTGRTNTAYEVSPESSQTFVFPISTSWGSALETIGTYVVGLGGVAWKVNGNASIEVGGIPLFVPFSFTTH